MDEILNNTIQKAKGKGRITMKKKNIIVIFILTLIFLIIGILVRNTSEGILFDKMILDLIDREADSILFQIMKFVSFIGSAYFLIPFMIMVMAYTIYKKKYYILKLLAMSTLGSYVVNFIMKNIFSRTRPLDYFLVEQGGLSYPSGHSMVTMTFYMTLAYIASKNIKDKNKKKWIYLFAYTMIILMGISRLYLGVHWPTDVIGGYLIGYVFFYISIIILKEKT